jgi:hypothetical protein
MRCGFCISAAKTKTGTLLRESDKSHIGPEDDGYRLRGCVNELTHEPGISMTSFRPCCDRRPPQKFARQNKLRRKKPRRNEECPEAAAPRDCRSIAEAKMKQALHNAVEGSLIVFGRSGGQVSRPGQRMLIVNFDFQVAYVGLATDHRAGRAILYSLAILARWGCMHSPLENCGVAARRVHARGSAPRKAASSAEGGGTCLYIAAA